MFRGSRIWNPFFKIPFRSIFSNTFSCYKSKTYTDFRVNYTESHIVVLNLCSLHKKLCNRKKSNTNLCSEKTILTNFYTNISMSKQRTCLDFSQLWRGVVRVLRPSAARLGESPLRVLFTPSQASAPALALFPNYPATRPGWPDPTRLTRPDIFLGAISCNHCTLATIKLSQVQAKWEWF